MAPTAAKWSISASWAAFASIPGGMRRLMRARASGWMAASAAGDRRAVDAQHGDGGPRPDHVGDAVTEQVDAVEDVGVLAELLGRVLRAAPGLGVVEPADRRVALLVAQRREHADEGGEGVGRGAAEHAGVHRARQRPHRDHDLDHAPQGRRQARHADGEVPGVADEDHVGAEQVGVPRHEVFEAAVAELLGALADDLHVHGQLTVEGAQGGQMRDDVALAVGRAAAVPAAVPLGQLPRRGDPRRLVERRLDVVVEVQQHRRRARRAGGVTADGLAPVGRLVGPDLLQADTREQLDGQVDHLVAVLGWGSARVVHGLVGDHPGEILLGLRHQPLHPFAQRVS